MIWLIGLPSFLCFVFFFNRQIAKGGDYFKVDGASHALEICRIGRTFRAGEIIAFTELTRWHRWRRYVGKWQKTRQTGVLVRSPNQHVELYPVIRDREIELSFGVASFVVASFPLRTRRVSWAERLAGVFQVPIRRIELSKAESKALNDC